MNAKRISVVSYRTCFESNRDRVVISITMCLKYQYIQTHPHKCHWLSTLHSSRRYAMPDNIVRCFSWRRDCYIFIRIALCVCSWVCVTNKRKLYGAKLVHTHTCHEYHSQFYQCVIKEWTLHNHSSILSVYRCIIWACMAV